MSFRMKGRALRAARYAATWLLLLSMTSSTLVLGAPNRRELRKAKRNGCCPAPACSSTCGECNACTSGGATVVPTIAPPASNAPAAAPAPPAPSPPKAGPTARREGNAPMHSPVIVTNQSPPAPVSEKPDRPKPAPNLFVSPAITESTVEAASPQRKPVAVEESDSSDPFAEFGAPAAAAPSSAETPSPANSGSRYQEYLDRYFKGNSSTKSDELETPKSKPAAFDDAPALESNPSQEYNDPFRPTSYRNSQERTWRDSSGELRMKARFLGVDEKGMARMLRDDGRATRIPLTSLSKSDQRFIELLAIRDLPNAAPQAIASRPKK